MCASRILLTGGGTGGHIYPALSLASHLRSRCPDVELLYVGTASGLEAQLVPRAGLPFVPVRARGFAGKSLAAMMRAAVDFAVGYRQSRRIIRDFRPQAAVGTGGYVTGPVLFAAAAARVPIVIHEQNAYPGVANRWLSRYAHTVAVPFDEARDHFPQARRVVTTGNPVRPEIIAANREEARKKLAVAPDRPLVLIMSGSRGARTINKAAAAMLTTQELPAGVILVTGEAYYESTLSQLRQSDRAGKLLDSGQLRVYPYLDRMDWALAAADLAVARAGATTIAELTVRGLPSILIPSPNVSHDHQRQNAALLARAGAAAMLDEDRCTGDFLATLIRQLLADPKRLEQMAAAAKTLGKPRAGHELARLVLEAASGNAGERGGPS